MTDRDFKKMQGCHSDLIVKVHRVFKEMAAQGHEMMVTDGARTAAEQALLYAKGRTAPGRVVTYADGLHNKSNHQSGRAVDCTFVVDGKPSWDESLPWELYGQAAEREGLVWGGRWKSPKTDKPHIEMPVAEPVTEKTILKA